MTFKVPEEHRIITGPMGSAKDSGPQGAFIMPHPKSPRVNIICIAAKAEGWEHVSLRCHIHETNDSITPPWDTMCYVKDVFWDPEDLVVQFHPPASDYVNNHPNVLHLWRKADTNEFCELPPKWMV
jgi:hypothetical protein